VPHREVTLLNLFDFKLQQVITYTMCPCYILNLNVNIGFVKPFNYKMDPFYLDSPVKMGIYSWTTWWWSRFIIKQCETSNISFIN
jgi:hypothetical protein